MFKEFQRLIMKLIVHLVILQLIFSTQSYAQGILLGGKVKYGYRQKNLYFL